MWQYLNKVGIYALVLFVVLTVTSPVYAVSPLYFYDWYQGNGSQLVPPGYPAWLENNIQDKTNVSKAIKLELYTGYPDQTLKLTDNITRAEFAVALARTLNIGEDGGSDWYDKRLDALIKEGVIASRSGDWSAPVTRGEMGQWTGIAASKFKAEIKKKDVRFTDTTDSNIITAAKTGIISGYEDGSFKPKDRAQRVHAALMLVRLAGALNSGSLPKEGDLNGIANKCFEMEQQARKDWVQGKTKILDYTPVDEFESELNLKWLGSVEAEYQKQKPDYGWAEDAMTNSAKAVELHGTTAVIEVSGSVQNFDKFAKKLYDKMDYKGRQYFIKRGNQWLITHSEPLQ